MPVFRVSDGGAPESNKLLRSFLAHQNGSPMCAHLTRSPSPQTTPPLHCTPSMTLTTDIRVSIPIKKSDKTLYSFVPKPL